VLHRILSFLDSRGLVPSAQAHCDIPCGIYDPGPAIISAVTVVRLMDIMHEASSDDKVALANVLARNAVRKHEEAEAVKTAVRVIWGDYFKGPLLEKYPHVHSLAHSIMLKASACKQDVHREDGLALVELVNEFAALFWESKGVEYKRGTSPYAPKLEVVYPILS